MTLYFRHVRGSKNGEIESYDLDRLCIGRLDDNDLRFDPYKDGEVSGRHALISRDGDTFLIEDPHSTNGTYVNGRRVTQPTPLTDGAVIEFSTRGPKVIFSTTAPSTGTIVVTDEPLIRPGPGSKTVAMMISDALREARAGGKGRFGSTTVFMRQLLKQASTHSSKRLRLTVLGLVLFFIPVIAGLIYANWRQGKQIGNMTTGQKELQDVITQQGEAVTQQGDVIKEQKQELQAQREALSQTQALLHELQQRGLDVRKTDDNSIAVNLPNVLFSVNSSELTAEGLAQIISIAAVVKENAQGRKLRVKGHASSEGSDDRNVMLSAQRASIVANALARQGIARETITAQGLGSGEPITADETTEEGRQKNRRVEVIITAAESTSRSPENK